METMRTLYRSEKRTEIIHIQSDTKIVTDAPIDNNGKGESFSPTDLVATALGSCIYTIMGIAAENHGFNIYMSTSKTTKIMASDPRRIGEIVIEFDFRNSTLSDKHRKILHACVKECPVAHSLHPDLKQTVTLIFE